MISDPKLAAQYAMAETDPLVLESMFATLIERTPERESREAARLIRAAAREDARTAAIPRLTRAKRYLDDAYAPLAALAGLSNHQALTDALPALAAIATLMGTAADALTTSSLTVVLTDVQLPTVPTTDELSSLQEGAAGAYALAMNDPDGTFAPAVPIYRDVGLLANRVTIITSDPPPAALVDQQELEWRQVALAVAALAATGAYDEDAHRYTHDSRLFVAATLAFRANQLQVYRKLGVPT